MTLDIDTLPNKQRQVLEAVIAFIQENGYSPSIQQLCDTCGVSSTSTIHYHLSTLKKKGFIHWNPAEKRAITVNDGLMIEQGVLPLLGSIAAGSPLETITDSVEKINLGQDLCPEGCYALTVRGESMIEDHIMDGDIVIINPKGKVSRGDVAVALVDGETATLKRIYKESNGMTRLQPANSMMEPIMVRDVQLDVQGKVEAVIRKVF